MFDLILIWGTDFFIVESVQNCVYWADLHNTYNEAIYAATGKASHFYCEVTL